MSVCVGERDKQENQDKMESRREKKTFRREEIKKEDFGSLFPTNQLKTVFRACKDRIMSVINV